MELKSRKLVLTFGTDADTTQKLTISKPGADLNATDIKLAMENIIASGALGDEASLTSIGGAKYTIQQEEQVVFE